MDVIKEEESQEVAFNIILHSGEARSDIHEAMGMLREGNFADAKQKMEDANEALVLAHKAQTHLLQEFSRGVKVEVQIIMVHAQDHLMTTMTLLEVAKELEFLYKKIQ